MHQKTDPFPISVFVSSRCRQRADGLEQPCRRFGHADFILSRRLLCFGCQITCECKLAIGYAATPCFQARARVIPFFGAYQRGGLLCLAASEVIKWACGRAWSRSHPLCSSCLPCRLVRHPGRWLPAIVFFRLFVLHNNKNVGLFVCPGRSTVDLELGYIEYTSISSARPFKCIVALHKRPSPDWIIITQQTQHKTRHDAQAQLWANTRAADPSPRNTTQPRFPNLGLFLPALCVEVKQPLPGATGIGRHVLRM